MSWKTKSVDRQKLENLIHRVSGGYPVPCFFKNGRLVKLYTHTNYTKFLQKKYNRKFRHMKDIDVQGRLYKKVSGDAKTNSW